MAKVLLTIHKTNENWIPLSFIKQDQISQYKIYTHLCEYSKSARATCRKCGQKIDKGIIRIGTPIKYSGGEYGYINAYSHVECTRLTDDYPDIDLTTFDLNETMYGYHSLPQTDQEFVSSAFLSPLPPEHLISEANLPPIPESTHQPLVSPPYQFKGELLPHQLDGVGWLLHQEGQGMCLDIWKSIVSEDHARLSLHGPSSSGDVNMDVLVPTTSQGLYSVVKTGDEISPACQSTSLVSSHQQPSTPTQYRVPLPGFDNTHSNTVTTAFHTSRGGILSDEMGLGKTVQVIALILEQRYRWFRICDQIYHHQLAYMRATSHMKVDHGGQYDTRLLLDPERKLLPSQLIPVLFHQYYEHYYHHYHQYCLTQKTKYDISRDLGEPSESAVEKPKKKRGGRGGASTTAKTTTTPVKSNPASTLVPSDGPSTTNKKGKPRLPRNPLQLYIDDNKEDMKVRYPDHKMPAIRQLLKQHFYASEDDDVRLRYQQKAADDKQRYQDELAEYDIQGGGDETTDPHTHQQTSSDPTVPLPIKKEEDDDLTEGNTTQRQRNITILDSTPHFEAKCEVKLDLPLDVKTEQFADHHQDTALTMTSDGHPDTDLGPPQLCLAATNSFSMPDVPPPPPVDIALDHQNKHYVPLRFLAYPHPGCGPTLVVAPTNTIVQWKREFSHFAEVDDDNGHVVHHRGKQRASTGLGENKTRALQNMTLDHPKEVQPMSFSIPDSQLYTAFAALEHSTRASQSAVLLPSADGDSKASPRKSTSTVSPHIKTDDDGAPQGNQFNNPHKSGGVYNFANPFSEISGIVDIPLEPRPLRVLIYYGGDRHIVGEQIAQYDVIITSYNVVAQDWKNYQELLGVLTHQDIDNETDDDDQDDLSSARRRNSVKTAGRKQAKKASRPAQTRKQKPTGRHSRKSSSRNKDDDDDGGDDDDDGDDEDSFITSSSEDASNILSSDEASSGSDEVQVITSRVYTPTGRRLSARLRGKQQAIIIDSSDSGENTHANVSESSSDDFQNSDHNEEHSEDASEDSQTEVRSPPKRKRPSPPIVSNPTRNARSPPVKAEDASDESELGTDSSEDMEKPPQHNPKRLKTPNTRNSVTPSKSVQRQPRRKNPALSKTAGLESPTSGSSGPQPLKGAAAGLQKAMLTLGITRQSDNLALLNDTKQQHLARMILGAAGSNTPTPSNIFRSFQQEYNPASIQVDLDVDDAAENTSGIHATTTKETNDTPSDPKSKLHDNKWAPIPASKPDETKKTYSKPRDAIGRLRQTIRQGYQRSVKSPLHPPSGTESSSHAEDMSDDITIERASPAVVQTSFPKKRQPVIKATYIDSDDDDDLDDDNNNNQDNSQNGRQMNDGNPSQQPQATRPSKSKPRVAKSRATKRRSTSPCIASVDDSADNVTVIEINRTEDHEDVVPPVTHSPPPQRGRPRAKRGSPSSPETSNPQQDNRIAKAKKGKLLKRIDEAMHTTFNSDSHRDLLLTISPLHAIHFSRVVTDEAHRLKNRSTLQYHAICAIQSDSRFCLTGTPIHNNTSDAHSLFSFIKHKPTSVYACGKQHCTCQFHYWTISRVSGICERCGHAASQHLSWFSSNISGPMTRYGIHGPGRVAFYYLNRAMQQAILRRTKEMVQHTLRLPPITVTRYCIHVNDDEKRQYEDLFLQTSNMVDAFAYEGLFLKKYAHIFALLSALRICCNHPGLVKMYRGDQTLNPNMLENLSEEVIEQLKQGSPLALGMDGPGTDVVDDGDDVFILEDHESMEPRPNNNAQASNGSKLHNHNDDIIQAPGNGLTLIRSVLQLDLDEYEQRQMSKQNSKALQTPPSTMAQYTSLLTDTAPTSDKPVDANSIDYHSSDIPLSVSKQVSSDSIPLQAIQFNDPRLPALNTDQQTVASFNIFGNLNDVVLKHTVVDYFPPDYYGTKMLDSARPITLDQHQAVEMRDIMYKILVASLRNTHYRQPSSKVSAICSRVLSIHQDDENNKIIIFSQYNEMLKLLQHVLTALSIPTALYTGSQPLRQRAEILTQFHQPPSIHHLSLPPLQRPARVLLMNLKASSEGLNLQCANHVLLVENWWNSAVELQAVSRIHRIGNYRPCFITQFHNINTIEEKMIMLQARKSVMIRATVDKQKQQLTTLSHEDIQFLFRK